MDILKYRAKIEELEKSNEEKERTIKSLNKELNNVKLN
jgi:cell division protein FtsB